MTRSKILALGTLAAATLVTIATSPPYYGSWSLEDQLDALQFTMEDPEQAHTEALEVVTKGGLDEGYWGGIQVQVQIDAVQLQIPDQAEPDTGDTGGAILTEDLELSVVLLEDGEEISRQLLDVHPGDGSDLALAFHHYAAAEGCEDIGDCTVPLAMDFELSRPLQDGEVLVVDWGAEASLSGEFTEDGQPEPSGLEIALSQPE